MKKSKRSSRKDDIRYLKCTRHGKQIKAPWSIVCIHLIEGTANEWIPSPQSREQDPKGEIYDWLCAACDADFDRMMDEHDLTTLRPICVYCVEDIRAAFDPQYFPTLERKKRET